MIALKPGRHPAQQQSVQKHQVNQLAIHAPISNRFNPEGQLIFAASAKWLIGVQDKKVAGF